MIKAVIVEDEKHAVLNLTSLLKKYVSEVSIVKIVDSGKKALNELPLLEFDLLFLDIEYNDDFNAFDLLATWKFNELNVIFVTSYNKYAIKAFRYNAIDYITKPIDKDELIGAVSRAQTRIYKKRELDNLIKVAHAFKNHQIAIKSQNEILFVNVKDVLYVKADKEYSEMVYMFDDADKNILTSKNIGYWENELNEYPFIRIHKSFLVNIDHILSVSSTKIKLSNGTLLNIARERRKMVNQKVLNYKTGF